MVSDKWIWDFPGISQEFKLIEEGRDDFLGYIQIFALKRVPNLVDVLNYYEKEYGG